MHNDLTQGARNILAVYYLAGAAELAHGLNWYRQAHDIAQGIVRAHEGKARPRGHGKGRGVDLETVSAVLSALSPSNNWYQNVRDAERMISVFIAGGSRESFTVSTYNANKLKAWHILTGEHTPAEAFGRPTSLKTRAFWRNILAPLADAAHVVVDGHAYGIWLGERRPLKSTPKLRPATYDVVAEAYAEAARAVGISPSQMQAVTWVTWRNLHGVGEVSPQFDLWAERPGRESA